VAKSNDAFRTIGEVSQTLDTPAHVLRFWESKFSQVKPVKRAGGRRYYRPDDVALLGGIKALLHDDGMTIKGAQKLLREKGVAHVCARRPATADEPRMRDVTPKTDAAPATPPDPSDDWAPIAFPERPDPVPPAPPANDDAPTNAPADTPTVAQAPPAPRVLPDIPDEGSATGAPGIRTAILRADGRRLRGRAARIAPIVERLVTLQDWMNSPFR